MNENLTVRFGNVILFCSPEGGHYHVTVRGKGPEGNRPFLGSLIMGPEEWHDLVDAEIALHDTIGGEIE